jgi:hypothetical protein
MATKFDAYFSFDRTCDCYCRDTLERVTYIASQCEQHGLRIRIGNPRDSPQSIIEAINSSRLVFIFVTQSYEASVNVKESRHAFEFSHAVLSKSARLVIPVALEEHMSDSADWRGMLGHRLGGTLFVRLWDDDLHAGVTELVRLYLERLQEVRERPVSPSHTHTRKHKSCCFCFVF